MNMTSIPRLTRSTAEKAWAADLRKSNLTVKDAKSRGWQLKSPQQTQELTRTRDYKGAFVWSYLIPYHDVDGKKTGYWRIRYLEEILGSFGARPKKPRRYTGPKGAKLRIFFDPKVDYSSVRRDSCE